MVSFEPCLLLHVLFGCFFFFFWLLRHSLSPYVSIRPMSWPWPSTESFLSASPWPAIKWSDLFVSSLPSLCYACFSVQLRFSHSLDSLSTRRLLTSYWLCRRIKFAMLFCVSSLTWLLELSSELVENLNPLPSNRTDKNSWRPWRNNHVAPTRYFIVSLNLSIVVVFVFVLRSGDPRLPP